MKLGVLFLAVVLVIATIAGVIYLQTGDKLRTDTEEQLVGTAAIQAGAVGEWVQSTTGRTRSLAQSLAATDRDAVGPYLATELERHPDHVVALHYVDTTTTGVVESTDSDVAGTTLESQAVPWAGSLGDLSAGSVERSDPYDDPSVGGPGMAFVAPIEGQQRAVVVVVDLVARAESMRSSSPDRWTHVVDEDGVVVLSHRTGKIGGQNMGEPGVDSMGVKRGLKGETGYVEMQMQGRAVSMGYVPVEGADWVTMTHVESADAFALQRDVLGSIALLVAAAVLGLLVVGVTIGRNTAQALEALSARARQLDEGDLDVTLETDRVDEIGHLYASFDAMRGSLRERIAAAEQAEAEAEAARQEAEALSEHLEAKATAYERVMQDCADGNLDRRLDPKSDSEAMESIATSFNRMMDRLEATIHELKAFAEEVAGASEEVTASSEEVQSSSDQVASSVQQISDGTDEQRSTLQSVVEEMNALSTTIEEMAASANQVAKTAELTAETGDQARATAETAVEEMADVEAESDAAVAAIEDLEDSMEEIEEVTEFIQDVAEQTNILALNANIEAARAGEAGEGFAVVADEVKSLAEETRQAAEEIDSLVGGLRDQTADTVDEVRSTSDEVAASADAVQETVDALQEIAEYAAETNTGVQEITETTEQQATSTNEVVSMVDESASIAEETAEQAATVAGAAEEQTAALSEMSDSAGSLAAEADGLRGTLDHFETTAAAIDDPVAVEGEDD